MIPLISILCPTYNGAKWIGRAIESVLKQSFKDFELLIIDDGSTDQTAQIVHQYMHRDERIKYFKSNKNLGVQKSSNLGLKEAQGEFIARIDDDDEWIDKNKLKKQFEFLRSFGDYGLVGTGVAVADNHREVFRYLGPQTDKEIRRQILYRNCFTNSTVLFRRRLALELGGYNESREILHLEDYDLWLRIGTRAKFANLPIYAVKYSLRGASLSSKNKLEQLKKQRRVMNQYKNNYPNYASSLIKSELRFILYALFGWAIQGQLRHWFLKRYKNL